MVSINDKTFKKYVELAYKETGIVLNESKKTLLVSRLTKRLKTLSIETFEEYYDLITSPSGKNELVEFVNRITTNKTEFFRENHHFDFMKQYLIDNYERKNLTELRIWCSASSMGNEPYTIAMVLRKFFDQNKMKLNNKVLCTDIDTNVLGIANAGIYPIAQLSSIPNEYRDYIKENRANGTIEMSSDLKNILTFKKFNLMHQFPFRHGFDIIFCRNVIIYFNMDDKRKILTNMYHTLRPDGILFLGHSENLVVDHGATFKNLGRTIFQKT